MPVSNADGETGYMVESDRGSVTVKLVVNPATVVFSVEAKAVEEVTSLPTGRVAPEEEVVYSVEVTTVTLRVTLTGEPRVEA